MITNPLPNHVMGNESINAIDMKYQRILKVMLDKVYERMVNVLYKRGINYCKHHGKEGRMINQYKLL